MVIGGGKNSIAVVVGIILIIACQSYVGLAYAAFVR